MVRLHRCVLARVSLLLAIVLISISLASAHVLWSHVNKNDADLLALYHFDNPVASAGDQIQTINDLPRLRGLILKTPAAASMHTVADTNTETANGAIFKPYALRTESAQIAESSETLTSNVTGDLTIEFWLKWDPSLTSQSVRVGLNSAAKLEIARDTLNPANDRFGLRLTHNDYASAPDFTTWAAIGEEEAPFGEWLHAAVTIQSSGIVFAPALGHDIYTTGTIARFWLNGHPFGNSPFTVSLGNLRLHDASTIRVQALSGSIEIDEITIWKRDWSNHGQTVFPFGNGRGSGLKNAARHWLQYDQRIYP